MNYLVSYDISDNKRRKRMIDSLFENGFRRIQKSVFLGELKLKEYRFLAENFSKLLDAETDKLFFISISESEYNNSFIIGECPPDLYDNEVLFI